jgi:hypothetical protein
MRNNFFFTVIALLIMNCGYSQDFNGVSFAYDDAGNQIKRFYCLNCTPSGRSEMESSSESMALDLNLKAAPNPVKYMLELMWDQEVTPISYSIFTTNGNLLKTDNIKKGSTSIDIEFQQYEAALYLVEIKMDNGLTKTFKIIKE